MNFTKNIIQPPSSYEDAQPSRSSRDWSNLSPPSVAIIITHHNYSHFIAGAIDSVLAQSYPNYQLVVVDDCSAQAHLTILEDIISKHINKLILVREEKNVGQVNAFYSGFQEVDADFYCLLDPDDRYFPNFLEEMVNLHLNPYAYVPMVGCDQVFVRDGRQVTGTRGLKQKIQSNGIELCSSAYDAERYFVYPPEDQGWYWASTSSLMFRKEAIALLKPRQPITFRRQFDAYVAPMIAAIGGCAICNKPLVQRSLHTDNGFIAQEVVSCYGKQHRAVFPSGRAERDEVKAAALESLILNNGISLISRKSLRRYLDKRPFLQRLSLIKNFSELRRLLGIKHICKTLMRL